MVSAAVHVGLLQEGWFQLQLAWPYVGRSADSWVAWLSEGFGIMVLMSSCGIRFLKVARDLALLTPSSAALSLQHLHFWEPRVHVELC